MSKKAKKSRNLLVLLIMLAVVCIGYFFLMRYTEAQEEMESLLAEETEAEVLLIDEMGTVNALTYEYEGEEMSFVLVNDEWQRADDSEFPLIQSSINQMVEAVTDAPVIREVVDAPENLEQYGLEDPYTVVTIEDEDGRTEVLKIGELNTVAGGVYVMKNDSTQVYLSDSGLDTAFCYGWMDLLVVDDGPGIMNTEVRKITIMQDEENMTLRYFTDGLAEADPTESVSMFLERADGTYMPVDSSMQSAILNVITALEYQSVSVYRATEEETTVAGFDAPTAVITVEYEVEVTVEVEAETAEETGTDEETEETTEAATETVIEERVYTLTVAGYDDSADTYEVMYEGGESILTMDASEINTLLELTEESLANLSATAIADSTVDKIEIITDDVTRTITVSREEVPVETEEIETESTDESDETESEESTAAEVIETETVITYALDGEEITASEFSTIWKLLQIEGERTLTADEKLVSDNELRVIFYRNTDTCPKVIFDYIPYNSNYYQLAVNGEEPSVAVNIRDVEAVLEFVNE